MSDCYDCPYMDYSGVCLCPHRAECVGDYCVLNNVKESEENENDKT